MALLPKARIENHATLLNVQPSVCKIMYYIKSTNSQKPLCLNIIQNHFCSHNPKWQSKVRKTDTYIVYIRIYIDMCTFQVLVIWQPAMLDVQKQKRNTKSSHEIIVSEQVKKHDFLTEKLTTVK